MFASRKEIIGFDDRWILILGIPIVSVLVNTLIFGHLLKEGALFKDLTCQGISFYYTLMFWLIFREANYWMVKRFPKFEDITKRQILSVMGIFLGYFVIDFVATSILIYVFKIDMTSILNPHPTLKIITSILFTFLTFVVYESFFLSNLLGKSQAEKQKLLSENIQSKLSSLQSQINPHFLFNSLNTLSSLIYEDPVRADKFVTKLSKVYRHILEQKETGLVTVESELTYLRAYVHLLKERFGNNLTFTEDIDHGILQKYIIPFSLQITFENCVKHNAATAEQPLHVKIFAENDCQYLCIENNVAPIADKDESTSVGLNNIKNRYSYFTKADIKVLSDGKTFKVCLPMLSDNPYIES